MEKTSTEPKSEPTLLTELRRLMPARPLRSFEHFIIAERQATELHKLLDQRGPAASLDWLTTGRVPVITVVMQPPWRMEGISGISTWTSSKRWVIGINKGHSSGRRRFTLAHEFKHVLDANRDKITYRGLNDVQRELVAHYFAACYLMPKLWVRRCWTRGLQDPEALAGLFKVSREAMDKRLRHLGYLDADEDRAVSSYFRRTNLPMDLAS